MTNKPGQIEHGFEQAASTLLQTEQGYYPAEVSWPELDANLSEFDVRLVQFDSYGTPNVIVMSVLNSTQRDDFVGAELRKHYLERIAEAIYASGRTLSVRVSVVLVSQDVLSAREARHRLGMVVLGRRPLREAGFYWVTPRERRFQSGSRFLLLASNSALNPCNPEPNIFTRLLRYEIGRAHV